MDDNILLMETITLTAMRSAAAKTAQGVSLSLFLKLDDSFMGFSFYRLTEEESSWETTLNFSIISPWGLSEDRFTGTTSQVDWMEYSAAELSLRTNSLE